MEEQAVERAEGDNEGEEVTLWVLTLIGALARDTWASRADFLDIETMIAIPAEEARKLM